MALPTPRGIRVAPEVWDGSLDALKALDGPRRVVVTLRPGMTRTDAVMAFLTALMRPSPRR